MYHSTLMCSSQDYLVKTPIVNRGGGQEVIVVYRYRSLMPHAHTWSSGEGRKKSSSKPTLTSMMTTSKSTNKRGYDNKGTYDNLREGNRNISSTSTSITAAAHARTAVLAKLTSSSWRGRKKSSSMPTLTSMMATPNSGNKWDYNDKGTYDNLQIAVAHHLIDLRNGSETHQTNKTSNDGYSQRYCIE